MLLLGGLALTGTLDLFVLPGTSLWLLHAVPMSAGAWACRDGRIVPAAAVLGSLAAAFGLLAAGPIAELDWLNAMWVFAALNSLLLLSFRLGRQSEAARAATLLDPLTGAANLRGLTVQLEAELNRCRRTQTPLTLVMLDCDDFKRVNDQRGHLFGDRLLIAIGDALRRSVRSYDLVARVGGDEFAVLLPGTDRESAPVIVERLQRELRAAMEKAGADLTLSIGAFTCAAGGEGVTAEQMRESADRLLYKAKAAGKDQCAFGGVESVEPDHG